MYYGRKKKIIVIIVSIIVVIALAIGGFLVYAKTDLFKSSKSLFWKYAVKGINTEDTISFSQIEELQKLKMQKPYKTKGSLTANSSNTQINNSIGGVQLSIESENDKTQSYSHKNYKLTRLNYELFNLDYVVNDNIYALKSDEIVLAFVGIRNENLKVLAQKLGMNSTNMLPDQINSIDLSSIKLTDAELQYIYENYKDVIINQLPDSNYSKQTEAVITKNGNSYNTTSYRLDLSSQDIQNVITAVLNNLKTDSITLNLIATRAKLLGLSDEYSTIGGLNTTIDKMISDVQRQSFTGTSIVVYSYNDQTIATEIIEKNKEKITVYSDKNNIKFIVEDLSGNSEYTTLTADITYKTTSTATNIIAKITKDNEQIFSISYLVTGAAQQGSIQTDANVSIEIDQDNTIEFDYTQTHEFVDSVDNLIELNETNCAILNDYTQEQLSYLLDAISNQISLVLGQKMQMLGLMTNEQIPQDTQTIEEQVQQ